MTLVGVDQPLSDQPSPEERAHAVAINRVAPSAETPRRLSWFRLALVVLLVAGIALAAVVLRASRHAGTPAGQAGQPASFSPYADVSAAPEFDLASAGAAVTLGFVVSAPDAACQPSWGGVYSLAAAATGIDLDRRVALAASRGTAVSVSFGGQANSELAVGCTSTGRLAAAYRSVLDRYATTVMDLDIEGSVASAPVVNERRAAALASVVAAEKAAGRDLAVWLTLPVGPAGLSSDGRAVLTSMLAAHVPIAGVNAMTMDFGARVPAHRTMAAVSEAALSALHGQLVAAYHAAGTRLSADQAWNRVGATPMIGQNDTIDERFELSDARALVAFARQHHLGRLSMWSLNRDQSCGPNYPNVEVVSDGCSGVNQDAGEYRRIFAGYVPRHQAMAGSAGSSTGLTTAAGQAATIDNPATSPYPIWNSAQSYPANSKVVWHHNVYLAKWWTEGFTPDTPVRTSYDTPWTLIGPVLAGDKPATSSPAAAPAGHYAAWGATRVYVAGNRVVYHGVGYQAKWWTQGDVPGANVPSPSDTPWAALARP